MMTRISVGSSAAAAAPLLLLFFLSSPTFASTIPPSSKVDHIIHILVDGLRPDIMFSSSNTNFNRLRQHGACTGNARLDPLSSQTLPNHISMFTGIPTRDHGYHEDADDGGRLPSGPDRDIFDLVKYFGGTTAFYGSKEKFAIFDRSWDIDRFEYQKRGKQIVPIFLEEMARHQYTYAFLHIRNPDRAGHGDVGADSSSYRSAVAEADGYLGDIFALINNSLQGSTGIILTSDHGFADRGNHADIDDTDNFRIPFCVSGPGVEGGADLYDINTNFGSRVVDPRDERADDNDGAIRNVNSAALAADWLGFDPEYGALSDQYLALSDGASMADSGVGSTNEEEYHEPEDESPEFNEPEEDEESETGMSSGPSIIEDVTVIIDNISEHYATKEATTDTESEKDGDNASVMTSSDVADSSADTGSAELYAPTSEGGIVEGSASVLGITSVSSTKPPEESHQDKALSSSNIALIATLSILVVLVGAAFLVWRKKGARRRQSKAASKDTKIAMDRSETFGGSITSGNSSLVEAVIAVGDEVEVGYCSDKYATSSVMRNDEAMHNSGVRAVEEGIEVGYCINDNDEEATHIDIKVVSAAELRRIASF